MLTYQAWVATGKDANIGLIQIVWILPAYACAWTPPPPNPSDHKRWWRRLWMWEMLGP